MRGLCPQPDRLSRDLGWLRALMPLSGLSQIQKIVLRCFANLCVQKLPFWLKPLSPSLNIFLVLWLVCHGGSNCA